jgi:hypothetical protein
MTKLSEVVRQTQEIEEQFEQDGPYLLEQLSVQDPAKDDSSVAKLYAHSVLAVGRTCDELIEMSRSQETV